MVAPPRVGPLLVLDVDGPVTDPVTKTITHGDVLPALAALHQRGWMIALNTGRALTSVRRMVTGPWVATLGADQGARLLADLVVACEKGAVVCTVENGAERIRIEERLRVDPRLATAIEQLVERSFSDEMFFDREKLTMVSVEMRAGLPGGIDRYHEAQRRFLGDVRQLVDGWAAADIPAGMRLRVDPTVIAVDVELQGDDGASKALGARRIAGVLAERGFGIARAVCIGDSPSDVEMSQELAATPGVEAVTHVHVGRAGLGAHGSVPVETAPRHHEAGTVWALERLLQAGPGGGCG